MKLICNNIRTLNDTFELNDNLNVLSGKNWTGKSSMIQIIKDLFRGKSDIKQWSAHLQYGWVGSDYESVIDITNGRIFESPSIDMDLASPWFLMWKGKLISGINKSMDDRRQTISRFLKIDRDWFFKKAWTSSDIKWLTSELKTLKTEESVLTWELMERESLWEMKMDKPKEVKLIPTTIWNQSELDRLTERSESIKEEEVPEALLKPKEVIFDSWNVSDLEHLRSQLEDIKTEGSNIPDSCDKCWQSIVDAEKMKASLRTKYSTLLNKINTFDLKESNQAEYKSYIESLRLYDNRTVNRMDITARNLEKVNELKIILKDINEFKLVESTKWNESEYEAYQVELSNYNANEQVKKSRLDDIAKLHEKIKAIPTIELELKIKKYKATELKFVESLKDKLIVGDMQFIFYKELKSPNTNWEMYKPTFEIVYKWKDYNECSGGEQGIIDVMIAYLFLEDRVLLIDNAEIGTEELKWFIEEYCKDIKVICTRITKSKLKLTHKF